MELYGYTSLDFKV